MKLIAVKGESAKVAKGDAGIYVTVTVHGENKTEVNGGLLGADKLDVYDAAEVLAAMVELAAQATEVHAYGLAKAVAEIVKDNGEQIEG